MQTGLNIALVKLTRKMLCYLRSTVKIFKRKSAIDLGEPELQHKTSKKRDLSLPCPISLSPVQPPEAALWRQLTQAGG